MNNDMDTTEEMTPMQLATSGNFRFASEIAGVCKTFVTGTAVSIKGKKFVPVEGWQSIAAAWGCTPEISGEPNWVTIDKNGDPVRAVRSEAILRRDSDGAIISRAFGLVAFDEAGLNSDLYAMEAKSQTRAISRVCRHKFSFVVTLMNAGLETTPYDEIPPGGFNDRLPASGMPKPPRGSPQAAEDVLVKIDKAWHYSDKQDAAKTWYKASGEGFEFMTCDDVLGTELLATKGLEVKLTAKRQTNKLNSYTVRSIEIPQPAQAEETPDDIPL